MSLLSRFWIYQSERFPFLAHGLLIAIFSFSAIAYSRICRGQAGFIDWKTYAVGIFITVTLFFLVRVFDEHKDANDDAQFRKELPVPRGLISLKELRNIGLFVFALQITLQAWFFPKMLIPFFAIIAYLSLMGKEFFIADWLKRHQFWYVTSHMFIIPLVDIYASGLDWFLQGAQAPWGLLFFFAVSYFNGIVLEVGRKIRAPESESVGVVTYSALLGRVKATWLWIGILAITLCLAITTAWFAGFGKGTTLFLISVFAFCSALGLRFLKNPSPKNAKFIEHASAIWTAFMYLSLGGIPMLRALLNF
jgi:hypothetical protein